VILIVHLLVIKKIKYKRMSSIKLTEPIIWCVVVKPYGTYTGYPRRNVKYFGRVFLMLNYTDITQNTYIQS